MIQENQTNWLSILIWWMRMVILWGFLCYPLQVNNRDSVVVGGLKLYDVKFSVRIGQSFGSLGILLMENPTDAHPVLTVFEYNNYGKSQGKPRTSNNSRASVSKRSLKGLHLFSFVMIRLYKDRLFFNIHA